MSDNEKEKTAIECSMSYTLLDSEGRQIASGDCTATISREYLTLYPKFGDVLPFHLRDINLIEAENYIIELPISSKEKLSLSNLGRCFEDFQRILSNLRNEVIIKDLLMNETIRKPDVYTEFTYTDEKGNEKQRGSARVRLYETGIVIIPHKGELLRIPYSDIVNVSEENYTVSIKSEQQELFILKNMGSEFDSFLKEFSNIHNELQTRAVSLLKTLYPLIDPVSLRRAAAVLKEGKAVQRMKIEAINPKLWQELEKKVTSASLSDSYVFLKALGRQERIAIGFKRGLMGNLTGEYIWFLVPIYGGTDRSCGNAIAMEATETTSEESTGKATYFFRLVSRLDYPTLKIPEQLDEETDNLINTMNRCMLDINFRREPIYLPEERLDEAEYVKYKIAIQRIPSLQHLRTLYVGRVIHFSPEQWKNDVEDLLRFNLAIQDDSAKWKKE